MRIYEASAVTFSEDVAHNRIAEKLAAAFLNYYGRAAGAAEITSWTNSLQFMRTAIDVNRLLETFILLEYELPYANRRIDCLLFGGAAAEDNAVLVELKQWSDAETSPIEDNVFTFIAGSKKLTAHPSAQAEGYRTYLEDFIGAFNTPPLIRLHSCVYCHNYARSRGTLHRDEFKKWLTLAPLFAKEDFEILGKFLRERLGSGRGRQLFEQFARSPIGPSKRLLDCTADSIAATSHSLNGPVVFGVEYVSMSRSARLTKQASFLANLMNSVTTSYTIKFLRRRC
jgi:hypothetical protein